ncbi:MAG TPA: SAM-dependent methyltransferase [Planctomycetes bacterium]|nr:SAM-dependent methyltransferase [Planctomycetota bacterium]
MSDADRIRALLDKPEFPRSAAYEPRWLLENSMGPNPVWLTEWLCEVMELESGMRVLDLGCGKAISSVFLAKEFDVSVYACDLWIGPDNNWRRAQEAGAAERVTPLRAEAHALPFASGFFDAVISIDAYHYFGTDQLYLGYLASFVRPGGRIGVALPSLLEELDEPPAHLLEPQANGKVFWESELWSLQSPAAWRRRWERCGQVELERVDTQAEGWRHWRDHELASELAGTSPFPSDAEALERDAGRTIGFVRAVARRNQAEAMNTNDPSLGVRFGIDV